MPLRNPAQMTKTLGCSDHQYFGDVFEAIFRDAETEFEAATRAAEERLEKALDQLYEIVYLADIDDAALASHLGRLASRLETASGYCGHDIDTGAVMNRVNDDDLLALTGYEIICIGLASLRDAGNNVPIDAASSAALESANTQLTAAASRVPGSAYAVDTHRRRISARCAGKSSSLATDAGFYGIPDPINNQPQLNVTLAWRARDPLVGQDEFTGKLTYEHIRIRQYQRSGDTFRTERGRTDDGRNQCLRNYLTEYRRRRDNAVTDSR